MLTRLKFQNGMPYIYDDDLGKHLPLFRPQRLMGTNVPPETHDVEYFYDQSTGEFTECPWSKAKKTKAAKKEEPGIVVGYNFEEDEQPEDVSDVLETITEATTILNEPDPEDE